MSVTKKETRHLLLTFDYELFLGKKSGSVDNCILKPTELILDVLKSQGITKSIFFIDTVYLHVLENLQNPQSSLDFLLIKRQLVNIVRSGHFIYPHIHPHWLDASYDESKNEWCLENLKQYRFHNIPQELRKKLFSYSLQLIKHIQNEAGVNFPISGYRAGGWCIQPFSDFKSYFIEHGIKHDFSVLRNSKFASESIYYDFTNVPTKGIYCFEDDIESENIKGRFKEYSISQMNVNSVGNLLNKFLLKYFYLTNNVNYGDGKSVEKSPGEKTGQKKKSGILSGDKLEMVSFELITRAKMPAYKKLLDNNSYIHFITHPKMLSAHNIKYFRKFLKYAASKYELQTDFEKMKSS